MSQEINPSVPHPEFVELAKKYEICDDAFSGNVSGYVEYLDGQDKDERQKYLSRAGYFGIVQPTVSALIGTLTRKPFAMTGSFPQTDFKTPDAFLAANFKNLLLGARTYTFVTVENGASKIISYDVDDVINWSDDFVVVKEDIITRDPKNPFKQINGFAYREMYLEDGMYHSRRWTKSPKGKWVFEELEDLTIGGNLLDYIPFWVTNPYDTTWECYSPPLLTQAAQNIQHFKQSCDLSHYAHFMALPTPYIAGDLATYQNEDGSYTSAKVHLGSTKEVLHLAKDASCGYLEVSGVSFKMLQDELHNIEERMFVSGSRLLTNKAGVESAAALSLRANNESATLETMTNALESTLNNALALCSLIDREEKAIKLNNDFNSTVTDPAMLKSLLELFAANVITLDQFQARLLSGEVIAE